LRLNQRMAFWPSTTLRCRSSRPSIRLSIRTELGNSQSQCACPRHTSPALRRCVRAHTATCSPQART
jgi:hypothetical protein